MTSNILKFNSCLSVRHLISTSSRLLVLLSIFAIYVYSILLKTNIKVVEPRLVVEKQLFLKNKYLLNVDSVLLPKSRKDLSSSNGKQTHKSHVYSQKLCHCVMVASNVELISTYKQQFHTKEVS